LVDYSTNCKDKWRHCTDCGFCLSMSLQAQLQAKLCNQCDACRQCLRVCCEPPE
jgi:hypothetical protein